MSEKKRPPAAPKLKEIGEFNQVLAFIDGLAGQEPRFLQQAANALKALEKIESDGNKKLRFHNYLKFADGESTEKLERDKAQIQLTVAKLRGEYTEPLGEELRKKTIAELKDYAEALSLNPDGLPKRKADIIDLIEKQFEDDEEAEAA